MPVTNLVEIYVSMMSHGAPERETISARFHAMGPLERLLFWFAGELALAAAVAWVAFQIQQDQVAPAVLFPLAVGAALGTAGALLAHALRTPPRAVAVAAAIVAGLLVVVGQDYIGHRYRVRQFSEIMGRQEPLTQAAAGTDFAQPEFLPYLTNKVRTETMWWILDVAFTCGAAAVATGWALASPRSARPAVHEIPPSSG